MKGRIYQKQNGALVDITPDAVPFLRYEVCEVYYFLNPALRPGFVEAAGGLITNAATRYPAAFQYLQTAEGGALCVNEAQWQALSTATYYTDASGNTEGWNGVGGVAKFVLDTANGTIRVPDLRGMYAEAAGLDSLAVGGVHEDKMRFLFGAFPWDTGNITVAPPVGVFVSSVGIATGCVGDSNGAYVNFDNSRTVPIGSHNVPRAWGAMPCVYLGS